MTDEHKTILDSVMARLWSTNSLTEPILALEVLYGPYTGAVFAFTKFELSPQKLANGMVPTKFETTVFVKPEGFREDEAWDEWTAELLMAWLSYLSTHDYRPLMNAKTDQQVH